MLKGLIQALDRAGVDLQVEDILDSLWLARQGVSLATYRLDAAGKRDRQVAPSAGGGRLAGETVQEGETGGGAGSEATGQQPEAGKKNGEDQSSGDGDRTPVYAAGRVSPGDRTIQASPVSLPAARALPGRLAMARALRPLRSRRPSVTAFELDEERTAEVSAEAGYPHDGSLYPVFHPVPERWFAVDIVVEDDPGVALWHDTLQAFRQMLRDTGAFGDVRLWRLRIAGGREQRFLLETPTGTQVPARTLGGMHAHRLILFATHGSSSHWRNGTYTRLLDPWIRTASVAVLQLLPRRLWKRTALGDANGICGAQEPGPVSIALDVDRFWWTLPADAAASPLLPLPVASLDAGALGEWSNMLMARGRRAPVLLLRPPPRMPEAAQEREAARTQPPVGETQRRAQAGERDFERIAGQFREASPFAFRLAVYLSQSSFTIPVARLVQEVKFGTQADQSQIAELLLSGLVFARGGAAATDDPNTLYYDFYPKAREVLLRSLRETDVNLVGHTLLQHLSQHLERIQGRAATMRALIPDAGGAEALPEWARPFAQVGQAMLGGRERREPGPELEVAEKVARLREKQPFVYWILKALGWMLEGVFRPGVVGEKAMKALVEAGLVRVAGDGHYQFVRGAKEALEAWTHGEAPPKTGGKQEQKEHQKALREALRSARRLEDGPARAEALRHIAEGLEGREREKVLREIQSLEQEEAPDASPLRGARILWVDDQPHLNSREIKTLRDGGAVVETAKSTGEALKLVFSRDYDVILSDMKRGSDDEAGFELLETVRDQHEHPPPVIFYAGRIGERRERAMAAGAYGFTNSPQELLELIHKAMLERSKLSSQKPRRPTPLISTAPVQQRFALLVGVDEYPRENLQLQTAVNDVDALEHLLGSVFKVTRLVNNRATRGEILSAFQVMCQRADPEDLILFHFSGHSVLRDGHSAFLLPVDAGPSNNPENWISHGELQEIAGWTGKRVLVTGYSAPSTEELSMRSPGIAYLAGPTRTPQGSKVSTIVRLLIESASPPPVTIAELAERVQGGLRADPESLDLPKWAGVRDFVVEVEDLADLELLPASQPSSQSRTRAVIVAVETLGNEQQFAQSRPRWSTVRDWLFQQDVPWQNLRAFVWPPRGTGEQPDETTLSPAPPTAGTLQRELQSATGAETLILYWSGLGVQRGGKLTLLQPGDEPGGMEAAVELNDLLQYLAKLETKRPQRQIVVIDAWAADGESYAAQPAFPSLERVPDSSTQNQQFVIASYTHLGPTLKAGDYEPVDFSRRVMRAMSGHKSWPPDMDAAAATLRAELQSARLAPESPEWLWIKDWQGAIRILTLPESVAFEASEEPARDLGASEREAVRRQMLTSPILNRDRLLRWVLDFADGKGSAALAVTGPPGSGKSFTRQALDYVARQTARFHPSRAFDILYIDLGHERLWPQQIADELIRQADWSTPVIKPDKDARRIARQLARWLVEQAAVHARRVVVLLDQLDTQFLPLDTGQFLAELTLLCSSASESRLGLILQGYDIERFPVEVPDREELGPLTPDDVREILRAASDAFEREIPEQLAADLLARLPDPASDSESHNAHIHAMVRDFLRHVFGEGAES